MIKKEDKIVLQDKFLSTLKVERSPATIFLINGVKLEGRIAHFDNFSICLERENHKQLVYKHAISTILPVNPIILFEREKDKRTYRK